MNTTCDTCKWWKDRGDSAVQKKCNSEKTVAFPSPLNSDEAFIYIEAIHRREWEGFYTGPKFGCIHHELKL